MSVLIEDRVSKRAVLRSVLLTPQQLEVYRANVFVAAAKTLTTRLLIEQDFLDFLEVADPLWKNILLEIPKGKRGVSKAKDALAKRYCDREEIGMFNEAFHRQCLSKFGGDPEDHLRSPYFLTEIPISQYDRKQGEILVVCTGDPEDVDKLNIHQTVSEVVDHETMLYLTEALLTGKVALPGSGQVYGKYTLDWMKQQGIELRLERAKTLREKAKADARALREAEEKRREDERRRIEDERRKATPSVKTTAAPGAR